ncbi:serine/threonine protein phosphatase 2A regulatory subunit B''beta-like protein [Tanacetum coccineum]
MNILRTRLDDRDQEEDEATLSASTLVSTGRRVSITTPGREFLLRVSYIEIYNEVIYDLVEPTGQNLCVREVAQGTYFEGKKEEVVLSLAHALSFIAAGEGTTESLSGSSSGSPRISKHKGPSVLSSLLRLVSKPAKELILQFYFQNGRPPPNEIKDRCLFRSNQFFYGHAEGLQLHEFKPVTKEVCKLPSFLSTALFKRIDVNDTGVVTREHNEYRSITHGVGIILKEKRPSIREEESTLAYYYRIHDNKWVEIAKHLPRRLVLPTELSDGFILEKKSSPFGVLVIFESRPEALVQNETIYCMTAIAKWECSSYGRALALHARGTGEAADGGTDSDVSHM